jgi:hypothetical protein
MFENGVLKRMFGSVRDKITAGWRIQEDSKLHLHFLPDIISTIRSRGMRLTGHAAQMSYVENEYKTAI